MFPDRDRGLWRPHTGAREKHEEQGAAERNCYVLTVPLPSPHPPVPLEGGGGRAVRSEGGKLSHGKKGVGGGKVLC